MKTPLQSPPENRPAGHRIEGGLDARQKLLTQPFPAVFMEHGRLAQLRGGGRVEDNPQRFSSFLMTAIARPAGTAFR